MKEHTKHGLITYLLSNSVSTSSAEKVQTMADWSAFSSRLLQPWPTAIERAIAGGFHSASVGMAFTSGYHAALQCIAPGRIDSQPASFCVTEHTGNSPSAICTRLDKQPNGSWILNGEKSFVTGAEHAQHLLVAATTGKDEQNRNRLAMVHIEGRPPGVTVSNLPALPFAPEISHGSARFVDVIIRDPQILEGDGYLQYVKLFRTIEDIHVSGAILGYLLGIAQQYNWPHGAQETLIAMLTLHQTLASMPAHHAATHIALAGARQQIEDWLNAQDLCWALVPENIRSGWQRDRALLQVASKARTARTKSAWDRVQESPP